MEKPHRSSSRFSIAAALAHSLGCGVSASEMIAELPKLSRKERRQLAAAIFELEEEADLLGDCDRRADERFRMLDMMEEEDAKASQR